MFGVTTSDDYRPVTWMGRFPVDVTTILVALHVVVAILTCLVVAAGGGAVLNFMLFDSARVLGAGQIWRLATYAFVHSPSMLLWFAIEMYMLFVFGREVERFIGQRAYHCSLRALAFRPFACPHRVGLGTTDRTGRVSCVAFRNFRGVRDDLPGGRTAAAYHRKMEPQLFWARSTSCNCWPTMPGPI